MRLHCLSGLALGLVLFVYVNVSPASAAKLTGCSYDSFPGKAVVVSVEQTPASSHQVSVGGGPGYRGYEVVYRFTPNAPLADPQAAEFAAMPHVFQLTNSWYPGEKFIAKYKLNPMQSFAATLKVIKGGACTPYVIELKGVDTTDYFETVAK